MIARPVIRLGLCLLLLSSVAACSAVPDRYAPWRDEDRTDVGHKPNLGDVPAAPNVDQAKAQIEEMRQRMESDRQNAYLSAQGLVPQDSAQAPSAPPIGDSDLAPPPPANTTLAPLTTPPQLVPQQPAPPAAPPVSTMPDISTNDLPAPGAGSQSATQNTQAMGGNIYYNYDPNIGNDYTYSNSAKVASDNVDINMPQPVELASTADTISSDPSVAIDMSVLGGSSSPVRMSRSVASSGGISTGEPIAYFSHGSAKLGSKDRAAIRSLAKQLKQRPQPVMLAGNSSRRTGVSNSALSRMINLKMSERRAKTVMDELVKQGVSPEQIFISAYGDAVPNRREDNGLNEAANRRVEVLFDR